MFIVISCSDVLISISLRIEQINEGTKKSEVQGTALFISNLFRAEDMLLVTNNITTSANVSSG